MNEQVSIDTFNKQANDLVLENRRLRAKSEADDSTIITLRKQYDELAAGVEDMVEQHKQIEEESREKYSKELREMIFRCDRAELAYKEIEGLLHRTGDVALSLNELIVQAVRARVGDATPEKMPKAELLPIEDRRLPAPDIGRQ